jgi:transposase InsO family protein
MGWHHGLEQPQGSKLVCGRRWQNTAPPRSGIRDLEFGICNSDQGAQFIITDVTKVALDAGGRISMDGCGRWIDSRMIERLWRSRKDEHVCLNAFETGSEARKGIGDWISLNRPGFNGE